MRKEKYRYGFNMQKEFREYKKVCSLKNKTVTYNDWKEDVCNRFQMFNEERKQNFLKDLSYRLDKTEEDIRDWGQFQDILKELATFILPLASLVFVVMQHTDDFLGDINTEKLKLVGNDVEEISRQLHDRADLLFETMTVMKFAMILPFLYVFLGVISYMFKRHYIRKHKFLKDFIECINDSKTKE